jgi:hypothetical protein
MVFVLDKHFFCILHVYWVAILIQLLIQKKSIIGLFVII